MNPHSGPLCTIQNLARANIIKFPCDRFQSKGDIDSITLQVQIISPAPGEEVNYGDLAEDASGVKLLPVRIVITPEFNLDFTQASSASTQ